MAKRGRVVKCSAEGNGKNGSGWEKKGMMSASLMAAVAAAAASSPAAMAPQRMRVAEAICSDHQEAEAEKKEEAGFVAAGETVVAAAVVVLLAGRESLDRRQPLRHGDSSLHSQTRSPQSQQKRAVTAFRH
ncbi:unnamed protein product [Linum trigynum]